MEFRINHEPEENKHILYCFGKGSIRRLQPEKYGSVESAKNAAYRAYSNEMASFLLTDTIQGLSLANNPHLIYPYRQFCLYGYSNISFYRIHTDYYG